MYPLNTINDQRGNNKNLEHLSKAVLWVYMYIFVSSPSVGGEHDW